MRGGRGEIRMIRIWVLVLALITCYMRYASGDETLKKKIAIKGESSQPTSVAKTSGSVVPSARPSILNTPIRKPATLDPNSAVEVRGQARTLSMMLVLKNGKDGINFIKVRKDYHPEILNTDF